MANERNLRPFTSDQSREKADLRKVIQTWLETQATTDKNGNPLSGAELMVAVAVKELVYSHKDEIIDRVVDRAVKEIVKKGLPKLMERME